MIKDFSDVWWNKSQTSQDAAGAAEPRSHTQKERVFQFLVINPGSSRQEIADGTGITLQAVCARVASLLEDERVEEEEQTKMGDYGTHVKKLRRKL